MNYGEIERAINSLNAISNAVCFYDNDKDKIICLYVGEVDQRIIVDELQKLIPKYMIPNEYVQLSNFPMNANGKIDRVKLKGEVFDKKC